MGPILQSSRTWHSELLSCSAKTSGVSGPNRRYTHQRRDHARERCRRTSGARGSFLVLLVPGTAPVPPRPQSMVFWTTFFCRT